MLFAPPALTSFLLIFPAESFKQSEAALQSLMSKISVAHGIVRL